jgi:hypothetical protein
MGSTASRIQIVSDCCSLAAARYEAFASRLERLLEFDSRCEPICETGSSDYDLGLFKSKCAHFEMKHARVEVGAYLCECLAYF